MQVCQDWNSFIMSRVWGTGRGAGLVRRKLERRWREAEPDRRAWQTPHKGSRILKIQIFTFCSGFYLAVDEKSVGLGTLDNKAVLLEATGGRELLSLVCQQEDRLTTINMGNLLLSEAESVQLDITDRVLFCSIRCSKNYPYG